MVDAALRALLAPEAVCVIGASADPKRIGGRLVRYSLEAGFEGRIYPVNPNRERIMGLETFPGVEAVPEVPDCAIIALPRDLVVDAAKAAADRGVRCIAVTAAGFAEQDERGALIQRELTSLARSEGVRILGPNSNGFIAADRSALFAFTPVLDDLTPETDDLAVITQSAGVGTYLLRRAAQRGIGMRYWVHTGNEADLSLLELGTELVKTPGLRAMIVAFEVLRDVWRLPEFLTEARKAGVHIVAMPMGTSPVGNEAMKSHTGAMMARRHEMIQGTLRQYGASDCSSIDVALNRVEAALRIDRAREGRLGIVSTSGGVGILVADALDGAGVSVPRLSESTQAALLAGAPYCHPQNPVDVTAQVINHPAGFASVLQTLGECGELDCIVVFIAHGDAGMDDVTTQQLLQAAGRHGASSTAWAAIGYLQREVSRALQLVGAGVFDEPSDLADGLSGLRMSGSGAGIVREGWFRSEQPAWIAEAAAAGLVDESRVKERLRGRGLPVVAGAVVRSATEAVAAAEEIGYPCVAKLSLLGLAHKAAVGGVEVGVQSSEEMAAVAERLMELADRLVADGHVHPQKPALLIEEYALGLELYMGLFTDPELGPMIVMAPGGTGVESAETASFRCLPLTEEAVRELLDEVGTSTALGFMAREQEAVENLVRLVMGLQQFWRDEGASSTRLDVNPVIVDVAGQCHIVDALIEVT